MLYRLFFRPVTCTTVRGKRGIESSTAGVDQVETEIVGLSGNKKENEVEREFEKQIFVLNVRSIG